MKLSDYKKCLKHLENFLTYFRDDLQSPFEINDEEDFLSVCFWIGSHILDIGFHPDGALSVFYRRKNWSGKKFDLNKMEDRFILIQTIKEGL